MATADWARTMLEQEARALLTRLERVQSFALSETMVPAANLSVDAQVAIERYLMHGRRTLRQLVGGYLAWLRSPMAIHATPAEVQRRFTFVRLRFNAMLAQFDIFADVVTQRSERQNGVWLSGLDAVAADALALPGYYDAPPVACYLDRGHGAAIRRARARLPGGGENPVAVIRVPRERMVGSGIASSLVHEVGHQAAELLDLLPSLRPVLRGFWSGPPRQQLPWRCWDRWISEIVADFWAVGRVGVSATLGLLAVVSLPRVFVFRLDFDDPHPAPWVRVRLSCAIGKALYPDPQWDALAQLWQSFYPLDGLDAPRRQLVADLEASMPGFVALLVNHRPAALRGRSLGETLAVDARQPASLRESWRAWRGRAHIMAQASPSLVFAVIGQARADGRISPEAESQLLAGLLTSWALRSTLDRSEICATQPTRHATRTPGAVISRS